MENSKGFDSRIDELTNELIEGLFDVSFNRYSSFYGDADTLHQKVASLFKKANDEDKTGPILDLFLLLKDLKKNLALSPTKFGITRRTLHQLALKHERIDEHGVTVGGRINRALPIVEEAGIRVSEYLERENKEAPSGIELWEKIKGNINHIKSLLKISDDEWNSYSGQIKNCIDTAEGLSKIISLPSDVIQEVSRVTKSYRMRLTPYYASLIQTEKKADPILLQCVPTGEMVDNIGIEISPVSADHSPARLIDQFYPRVVTIKSTNMCAMYCTHCLRIAHIGKKDRIYSEKAYEEALDYIRQNKLIRDVLITGGDAFVLPTKIIKKILDTLDEIDHVRVKRLGTRIPVTAPQRIDSEILDVLEESNDKKPLRIVTQINTAQEITPVSRDAFKMISRSVSAVLNQAVLLKGVNDSTTKMWKLCETIQESYVRPYYIFNCSYRNPQFAHLRVPIEKGRDIVESMYGNISGDAIPRYIATAGGKIPLHRENVIAFEAQDVILRKPWNNQLVRYPDADELEYNSNHYSFSKIR